MYIWENIRPGAWLQVVIQSKHRGDGERGQPEPYIPFLKVRSGTFYKQSPVSCSCLNYDKRTSTRMLWEGCMYRTFDWEGADLMEPVNVCHHFFVLSMFFSFYLKRFFVRPTAAARLNTLLACLLEGKFHSAFYVQSQRNLGQPTPSLLA